MKNNVYIGPPISLSVYKNDVTVKHWSPTQRPKNVGGKKQELAQWSDKSRKNLAFVAGNTLVSFHTMITLTYPKKFPSNGRLVKKHLNTFLTLLRRKLHGVSYLWFLEFQKRGAPHYHILINGRLPKNDLSESWYRIVGSNDTKHLKAGTRIETVRTKDGLAHYALKYAVKMEQKSGPKEYKNVGRMWGCSKDVPPSPLAKIELNNDFRERLRDFPGIDKDGVEVWGTLYGAAPYVTLTDSDIL